MTCEEIKALPKEFDFKSNINPFGLIYHAVEQKDYYVVTNDSCRWEISKKEIRRHLLKDEYVIAGKEMKFFRFYGYLQGEKVAGLVRAIDITEAKQILQRTYYDYNSWKEKTLEEVELKNDICEVYYGT